MLKNLLGQHQVNQVYLYEFLKSTGMNLIGIFIPIYLVSQGFNLSWAFYFLMAEYIGFMVFSFPISYIISNIGFKHSLVTSYFFFIPALVGLRMLEIDLLVLTLLALLLSLGKCFHFIALHAEFAVDSASKKRGKQTGRYLGIPKLGKMLAPAIGGFLMASFGFGWLVGATVGILLLSIVPLTASKDHRDPFDYGLRDFFDRRHVKFGSLMFFRGIGSVVGKFLFPLYVFLVVGGEFNAGIVGSLSSLGVVCFTLLVGRFTEKVDKYKLIIVGLAISALFFSLRAFVTTAFQAFAISFTAGMVMMLYQIPMFSDVVDMAEKEDVLEFFAFREVALAVGRISVLVLGVYIVLVRSSLQGLELTFHIAAAATLGMGLFAKWIERVSKE